MEEDKEMEEEKEDGRGFIHLASISALPRIDPKSGHPIPRRFNSSFQQPPKPPKPNKATQGRAESRIWSRDKRCT